MFKRRYILPDQIVHLLSRQLLSPELSSRLMLRLISHLRWSLIALFMGWWPASVLAAERQSGAEAQIESLSDHELTDLAADWESLDGSQRTELIQETRERMQPAGQSSVHSSVTLVRNPRTAQSAAGTGLPPSLPPPSLQPGLQSGGQPSRAPQVSSQGQVVQQRVQRRRYGRLVRQPDGSVLRIQTTEVVRIGRRDPKRAYGVGFEQRHPAIRQPIRQSAPQAALPSKRPAARPNILTVQDPARRTGP